jgi:hypothetical protein
MSARIALYTQALKWPVITWVLFDLVVIPLIGFSSPGTLAIFGDNAVMALEALVVGLWAGNKVVTAGGNYLDAIISGVIVGLVCMLTMVIALIFLDFDIAILIPGGVFLLVFHLFGAMVGGGYALNK